MKRSEMLHILEKLFQYETKTYEIWYPNSTPGERAGEFKILANEALTLIEEAGMLPPVLGKQDLGGLEFNYHEWEPEDD